MRSEERKSKPTEEKNLRAEDKQDNIAKEGRNNQAEDMRKKPSEDMRKKPSEDRREKSAEDKKRKLTDRLVNLEWEAFDKVNNYGGRADCQDDWTTFSIMRKSQYLTWSEELLESFIDDFEEANRNGRNLITEKYGRMMEHTDPKGYEKIRDAFAPLSEARVAVQEQIIEIQTGWMEEFARQYPKMAKNARAVHSSEDTLTDTSYETYLRGELSTYSDRTITLYGKFIVKLAKADQNLAAMTMENTAKLYGFNSLEDAEKSL